MMNTRRLALGAGLCLLLPALLTGCPGSVFPTWMIGIGDDADEGALAVVSTSDGGVVIAGFVEADHEEDDNAVLMKVGPHGRQVWRVEYGDDREDRALAVAQASDGGFVVAGQFGNASDEDSDGFLIKTDARGTEQWRRLFDSGGHDFVASVEATADGGYVLGVAYDLLGEARAAIVKTGADGAPQWELEAGEGVHVARATVAADGGYALAWWEIVPGELLGTLSGRVGILKAGANGTESWRKSIDADALAEVEDIRATPDGGFVLAGQYDAMAGDSHVMLWKVDASGNVAWQKTSGRGARDVAHAVRPTRDGGYVLAGSVTPDYGHCNMLLMKTDSNGEVLWERAFGGEDYDEAFDVVETRTGYFVVGMGESFDSDEQADNSEIVVIKTGPQGRSCNGEVPMPEATS